MIRVRTVTIPDPLARANVLAALAGAGGPAGVVGCSVEDARVSVRFDAHATAPELIDALLEISIAYVPARAAPFANAAQTIAVAAAGLDEPALDATRIIETYLA